MATYRSSDRFRETLRLSEDGELVVEDHRGFVVWKVNESGDVSKKGRNKKL